MTISAPDFARRTCAVLIRKGELIEDSRPHHVLHDELRAMYPAIRAAFAEEFAVLVSEWPQAAEAIRGAAK
jgi:hypothetical protein